MTQICLPLLDVHQGVEVFLYANAAGGQVEDSQALAARLAARGQHFVPIQNLTDEQAAARIREDGIDILVDLSGHAAPNRMLVFARKPAPIQLSWLGYPGNTGLAAIDFRLTDAIADPPGDGERTNGERLLRIERSSLCYVAPEAAGSVAAGEPRRGGDLRLFHERRQAVAGDDRALGKAAARVPLSRLLIEAPQFRDRATRERVAATFVEGGVAVERLDLVAP